MHEGRLHTSVHALSSHQVLLIKYEIKDTITKSFKMAITKHEIPSASEYEALCYYTSHTARSWSCCVHTRD